MASLLDYYYRMTGVNQQPQGTQYIQEDPNRYTAVSNLPIYDPNATPAAGSNQLTVPSIENSGASTTQNASTNNASMAATAATAKSGAADTGAAKTGASAQAGSSGMSKGQMGLMIGQMIGSSIKQAGTQPTVSIPQASPPPRAVFELPTISYRKG